MANRVIVFLFPLLFCQVAFGADLTHRICTGQVLAAIDHSQFCTDNGVVDPGDGSFGSLCATFVAEKSTSCNEMYGGLGGFLRGTLEELPTLVTKNFTEVFFAILSTILGLSALYFKTKLEAIRKRLMDPFAARRPIYESLGVNVLFVGIGGVGKTSLVRAITGMNEADPARSSPENRLYSIAHETYLKRPSGDSVRRLTRIFASDHVGQLANSILETEFYTEARIRALPKCLVLVVDIFGVSDGGVAPSQHDGPDPNRINQHLATFTPTLLQILTSKLGDDACIVLFINKLDMLKSISVQTEQTTVNLFQSLIQNLKRIRGAEVVVICGSANRGLGVSACEEQESGHTIRSLTATILETAKPARI